MKKISEKNSKSKWMVTYWCWECNFEFNLSNLEKPKCERCANIKNLLIISKENSNQDVADRKIIKMNDLFIESLETDIDSNYHDFGLERKELVRKLEKAKKIKNLLEAGNASCDEIRKCIR